MFKSNSASALPTQYQQFIHLSRYSRFITELNRRETFEESVGRLEKFYTEHVKEKYPKAKVTAKEFRTIFDPLYSLDVLPSMRALMASGPAAKGSEVSLYNCAYTAVDHQVVFSEILFILMNGTGVGFSVERQEVNKLPEIPAALYPTETSIIVEDSKLGWAKALKQLVAMLYAGEIPQWNDSKLRPAGAVLKTFGGRSSGPEPLRDLYNFFIKTFKQAVGRKLSSLECHDLVCMIGNIVVVGGVRRSALISLSNLSDLRMRDAKSGQWWVENDQRKLANNSVAYTEKPDVGQFMEEWTALYKSHSGERGIFNRKSAKTFAEKIGRNPFFDFGTNPCGEIILRSGQFCNLTELVARPNDTKETLTEKIRIATILGTIQSSFTDFKYLRKKWKDNCEEERLLGVSITGIMDCPLLMNVNDETKALLTHLRKVARDTNNEWADRLGIQRSAAITAVKPSGTASQLVDSASGIHARYAHDYIRRVRQDVKDPLTKFMVDKGFPHELDITSKDIMVFSFPMSAPSGSVVENVRGPIETLEHWKMLKEFYCDHNPSTTISVPESSWPEVGAWVWNNFDELTGLSFLPEDLGTYKQAPYERVSPQVRQELDNLIPKDVDWSELHKYESGDMTAGSQELACSAGLCVI